MEPFTGHFDGLPGENPGEYVTQIENVDKYIQFMGWSEAEAVSSYQALGRIGIYLCNKGLHWHVHAMWCPMETKTWWPTIRDEFVRRFRVRPPLPPSDSRVRRFKPDPCEGLYSFLRRAMMFVGYCNPNHEQAMIIRDTVFRTLECDFWSRHPEAEVMRCIAYNQLAAHHQLYDDATGRERLRDSCTVSMAIDAIVRMLQDKLALRRLFTVSHGQGPVVTVSGWAQFIPASSDATGVL